MKLSLQEKINEIIVCHSKKGLDLSNVKCYSNKRLIQTVATIYNLHHLKPQIIQVPLANPALFASVAVFDLKAQIIHLLHNNDLMTPENFAEGLDVFTGKTAQPITHIGEIHTGYAYENARDLHCDPESDDFPFPIMSFYDETHSDRWGCLTCTPFLWWPSFFKKEIRHQYKSVQVLGYVPNLKLGKGKSCRQSSISKLQEEHDCLRPLLIQLKNIVDEGGLRTQVMGRQVTVKPWLHCCCGDTAGHNKLCGRNGTSQRFRECNCPYHLLGSRTPPCITNPNDWLITTKQIDDASKVDNGLEDMYLREIRIAFDGVPLCDNKHGIHHQCPGEMLHAHGNGIIEKQLKVLVEMIGPNKQNMKDKEELDALHENMVNDSRRQSDNDQPRKSSRGGVCDGTKVTAVERVGNLHEILVMSYTATGQQLLKAPLKNNNVPLSRWRNCIKLQLSFEKWVHEENLVDEVKNAQPILSKLIGEIRRCFPRQIGNQWNIPKMHILVRMIQNMLRFGSAESFSGQHGERFLQSSVKHIANNTRRQGATYTQELASRIWEKEIIQHAFNESVLPYIGFDTTKEAPILTTSFVGKFDMNLKNVNAVAQS